MLYVVGFGPGDEKHMTAEAREVLDSVDVIAGYRTYTGLMKNLYPEKEYLVTGMKGEMERSICLHPLLPYCLWLLLIPMCCNLW